MVEIASGKASNLGKIKILIADDHAVVREGTRQILELEPDLDVVAEAADGEEAVRLAGSTRPDVAIIDIAMPKVDGIEATKQIKALYPAVAVLILSAYDDDQFVFGLLEAGAAGYLLKSVRGRELVEAVRQIHAGESVLHPAIARKVLNRLTPAAGKPVGQETPRVLSEREIEVLQLATRGQSNQEIANELCLSLRTVQAHLGHIFNKLQVSSRTEAVVRALKQGWVNLDDVS
ncbi:MAG: response regulator transcription factor [Deltaproteobacteria bacterium]|nr:response regulator transcription factor [Deltaproteobacteria bacterium]